MTTPGAAINPFFLTFCAGVCKHTHVESGVYSYLSALPSFLQENNTPYSVKKPSRHKDVKTTMVYTHVLNRGGKGVKSPVDDL